MSDDQNALVEYWRFYEPRAQAIAREVRTLATRLPAWRAVFESMPAEESESRTVRNIALQRAAILDGDWSPYLAELRSQGIAFADAGVPYDAWFDLMSDFRTVVRRQLFDVARSGDDGLSTAIAASNGLHHMVDIMIQTIGVAYLQASAARASGAESRYRAMFEHSPTPMWLYECETLRFIEVNHAAVLHYGYTRDEFLGMTIADIRPSEDFASLRADVEQRRSFSSGVWRHRKKDGALIFVEVTANDFRVDGRMLRLVLIHDVTERERAKQKLLHTEQQLQQAQKLDAIGRLAGGVAHDFNNLLTVIQSYAMMLEEQLEPADARHGDAVEIRRATERAHAITRHLLALGRHSIINPCSLDLSDLVIGFVPMLRRLVGERVTVVTQCPEVPPVIADRGQLEQVLMNLAVNARDAMPSGGRLMIETSSVVLDDEGAAMRGLEPGPHVALAVTDTGVGMDAETRRKVFEPFFSTKDASKGTGLGLSIVHGIVSQAGGAIAVYSEPGHGTAFWVHLPVATERVEPRTVVQVTAPRTLPPLTILVVDDQPDVRAVSSRILREAGCHVLEAATCDEARRICASHDGSIEVAIADVVLSDGRGDTLVEQLAELRPGLKRILMSGYPAGTLSELGGTPPDLVVKPFSPADLRVAVLRVVGDEASAVASAPARRSHETIARTRVLLADDDEIMRRALVRGLRSHGYEVVDVATGRAAIEAYEAKPFDVVLSDVNMPDGTGIELLRGIRRVDLDVPVVLMSGAPDVKTAVDAVEYGAFRFLTKPLDVAALCKSVEHAARVHRLARLRRDAMAVSGAGQGAGAAADRVGLEVRFDLAIERLWLAFQPIVDARSGVLYGLEALVRSDEPSMASPLVLLDAASQLGRLTQLGRKIRSLAAASFGAHGDDALLFVNLHPEDLLDIDLIDATSALTPLAPRVVLEVTERAALHSLHGIADRVAKLRTLGFRIAVDDIGAGYSGLTSFTELTPEIVKLDMMLVRDIHLSALKQRTVAALCTLCHEFGGLVVGEGVETLDERDCLVTLGCDLLQGYLIGRPARLTP
jgi:PAS domain S-box-containing protein